MGYNQATYSPLNGNSTHIAALEKVIIRGNLYGHITGLAGTAYNAGFLGFNAADAAITDLATFDASTYGSNSTVIFDWDWNEVNSHDDAGVDGDSVRVVPLNEVSFARLWYKDNVALVPGNKLTESATAGCVDLQVDATLSSNSLAYGFASSTAANSANGQSMPNYCRAISWTSLASVASRAKTPILGQINASW